MGTRWRVRGAVHGAFMRVEHLHVWLPACELSGIPQDDGAILRPLPTSYMTPPTHDGTNVPTRNDTHLRTRRQVLSTATPAAVEDRALVPSQRRDTIPRCHHPHMHTPVAPSGCHQSTVGRHTDTKHCSAVPQHVKKLHTRGGERRPKLRRASRKGGIGAEGFGCGPSNKLAPRPIAVCVHV